MPSITPPFVPTFGSGAPGAGVIKNQLYYDISTTPFTPYVYAAGAWHQYGATGGGANATQLQGRAISANAPNNNDILTWVTANSDWEPLPAPGSASAAGFLPGYQAGRWYVPFTSITAPSLITVGTTTLYAVPIYIRDNITLNGLAIHNTSAGNHARLGIYSNVNGQPSALLHDAGNLTITGTGFASLGALGYTMTPGWYWLVVGFDAACNVEAFNANVMYNSLGNGASFAAFTAGLTGAWTFGALPGTFPTPAYGSGNSPIIGFSL